MVAKYKINDKVILTDSGGGRNLFVDGAVTFNDSDGKTLTVTNTKKTLAPDFFTNYFYTFQGITSGYTSGGNGPSSSNVIDKFSFASDGNASDVGDLLATSKITSAGQSSSDNGYISGYGFPTSPPSFAGANNVIQKFPFSVDANATDVGDLTVARIGGSGQSSPNTGYTSGGGTPPPSATDVIDKFSFAVDANATDVGNLTVAAVQNAGQSSDANGYASGGAQVPTTPSNSNVINKFPFSTDENATDVGDLTQTRRGGSGQSSTTHGYTSGGFTDPGTFRNTIDKFSFSSDDNATDVGDLIQTTGFKAGQSSTVSGYASGGSISPGKSNVIEKFPFASDANSSDVGDLTQARSSTSGQQV